MQYIVPLKIKIIHISLKFSEIKFIETIKKMNFKEPEGF